MGETTRIPWCDSTWNPWQGCTKVSPGCDHCYMHREKTRFGQDPETVVRSKPATFRAPLSVRRYPSNTRVFVCSWSDFFHEAADPWREEAWDIILARPMLTFLILTKRPERIERCLPSWLSEKHPMPNVWLGVTVENQEQADRRIPLLLDSFSFCRFVSCEPLLGPVDLSEYLKPSLTRAPLDWVIVGGESGPDARPMEPNWARGLRDQALRYHTAFFFKQWGAWHPVEWSSDVDPKQMRVSLGIDGPPTWRKLHLCLPADAKPHETFSLPMMARMAKHDYGTLEDYEHANTRLDGEHWRQFP